MSLALGSRPKHQRPESERGWSPLSHRCFCWSDGNTFNSWQYNMKLQLLGGCAWLWDCWSSISPSVPGSALWCKWAKTSTQLLNAAPKTVLTVLETSWNPKEISKPGTNQNRIKPWHRNGTVMTHSWPWPAARDCRPATGPWVHRPGWCWRNPHVDARLQCSLRRITSQCQQHPTWAMLGPDNSGKIGGD